MFSFGTSVSINNLTALRNFHTFLFNYQLHEKPTWVEGKIIPVLRAWVEKKALSIMADLLVDESAKSASVSLNDVSSELFAALYIVQNPQLIAEIKTGQELFILLAQMTLEFVKIQKPRDTVSHEPRP